RALLGLEALEDRAVPATFLVSNDHDAGAGSLRQAILDSNATAGPNQIRFSHAATGTISLSTGELAISNDVTITGPGDARLKVSGMHHDRVFEIDSATVTITGLTIADGIAYNGAGLLNDGGGVTLSRVSMTNNRADGTFSQKGIADGGAITDLHGGQL